VVDLMDALRKSVGGAAASPPASKEASQEVEEGRARAEGDADAHCGQETGEGGGGEEACRQAAAEVGLINVSPVARAAST
jgi:hypothetical protein